jgi:hypothetical protein
MAQTQVVQGHIHRAQTMGAGIDAPLHVTVQSTQNSLGASRRFNGQTTQKFSLLTCQRAPGEAPARVLVSSSILHWNLPDSDVVV